MRFAPGRAKGRAQQAQLLQSSEGASNSFEQEREVEDNRKEGLGHWHTAFSVPLLVGFLSFVCFEAVRPRLLGCVSAVESHSTGKPSTIADAPRNAYIEVGVANGEILVYYAGLIPEGDSWDIIGFEPYHRNCKRAEKLVREMELRDPAKRGKVKIYHGPAWNFSGKTQYFRGDDAPRCGSMLRTRGIALDMDSLPVESYDLAAFLRGRYGPEDYVSIKMDAQGSEYPIISHLLKDGAATLVDRWLIRWHDPADLGIEDEVDAKAVTDDFLAMIKKTGAEYSPPVLTAPSICPFSERLEIPVQR
mmetsp:Transcript_54634/g.130376  ORF Transcript_54634/g.130376 Transcript_54634/m.130376 type:complete len:304 (+) Transcript_54634:183-1094(+)